MKWTAVIPARVGSQGVKGKNIMEVGGKPLVCHAVDAALGNDSIARVVVWTNDPAVRAVVEARYGSEVEVLDRPKILDNPKATIDEVCAEWMDSHGGPAVFLQPTLIPAWVYLNSVLPREISEGWWTVTAPVEGLVWVDGGSAAQRANRQFGRDPGRVWKEVGMRFCRGPQTAWTELRVADPQFVDIDTPEDLEYARLLSRPTQIIVFNLVADEKRGYGHLFRCMEVAAELQTEAIVFTGDLDSRARRELDIRGWDFDASLEYSAGADVLVVDRLDTTRQEMAELSWRASKVVTFENLGDGAGVADVVVNDMYWNSATYSGFDWTVLRPEFRGLPPFEVRDKVSRVLVTMGGTDPARFTEHAVDSLRGWAEEEDVELRVVNPPGRDVDWSWDDWRLLRNPAMAQEMHAADIVVCSAGRTLLEATAVGVPTVVVAQNRRETLHGAISRVGLFLGYAWMEPDLANTMIRLAQNTEARQELHNATRGLIDGRGTFRIARLIRDLGSGLH